MLLIALLVVAAVTPAGAQPILGKWTLDISKSKFLPGPAPKNQTVTFITDTTQPKDGFLRLIIDQVGPNGSTQTSTRFRFDGKRYPVEGSKDLDTMEATSTPNGCEKIYGFEGGYGFKITWSQRGSPLFVCNACISKSRNLLTIVTSGGPALKWYRVFERAR